MTRGAQIPYQGRPGDEILYGGAWYLRILSTYIAWRHPSGAYSFEMAPRFLEHMYIPDHDDILTKRTTYAVPHFWFKQQVHNKYL